MNKQSAQQTVFIPFECVVMLRQEIKMIVDLDYIATIKKALRRINAEDLDNLEFIINGKPVEFSKEDLDNFKSMGLNNTDINSVIGFTPK